MNCRKIADRYCRNYRRNTAPRLHPAANARRPPSAARARQLPP
jgi:hypothetical protein